MEDQTPKEPPPSQRPQRPLPRSDQSKPGSRRDPTGPSGRGPSGLSRCCLFEPHSALPAMIDIACKADEESDNADHRLVSLDKQRLAYAAAVQALFIAANIMKDFPYEHDDPYKDAKAWIDAVEWSLDLARQGL